MFIDNPESQCKPKSTKFCWTAQRYARDSTNTGCQSHQIYLKNLMIFQAAWNRTCT